MNISFAAKVLLAISTAAAMSSANAVTYTIEGRLDSIFNNGSTVVVAAYGSPWVSETIASAQASNAYPTVAGTFDISNGVLNSGSLYLAGYTQKVFLGDFFGVAMDVSDPTAYSFGTGYEYGTAGFEQTSGSVVAGHCTGPAATAICQSAYAGTPPLDYQLTDLGLIGGMPTWNLDLRFGTANPQITGGLTVMSFTLCAPVLDGPPNTSCTIPTVTTPVPAAAWLFGSGLIGLVRLARRVTSA